MTSRLILHSPPRNPCELTDTSQLFPASVATCDRLNLRRRDVEPLGNYYAKVNKGVLEMGTYRLAGSMGADGFRESGGRLVYTGSFSLTWPREPSTVTLRLRVSQPGLLRDVPKVRCDVHRKIVVRCLGRALTEDEAAPRLVALMDDLSSIFLVLRLAGERKLVFGLSVGNFVDTV